MQYEDDDRPTTRPIDPIIRDEPEQVGDEPMSIFAIDPKEVTPEHIATAETLLLSLHRDDDPRLWDAVALRLGSFYLELPAGDRMSNVDRALELYTTVLAGRPDEEATVAATVGRANSVVVHPQASVDDYEDALASLELLVEQLDGGDDPAQFAHVLGAYAHALRVRPYGDRSDALARGLAALKRAVSVLSEAGMGDSPDMGRSLHNLAALHLEQTRGVHTDHVDAAVQALRGALRIRTAEADPVGRVRSLRALAQAYPEWVGADSIGQALELADQASAEADWISQQDPSAAARIQGWAAFAGQSSALSVDLDALAGLDPDGQETYLDGVTANHRDALDVITPESMRIPWAAWMGGMGRLLAARYLYLGESDPMEEAYAHFDAAIKRVDRAMWPRLWRDLNHRLGEAAHSMGDWERSHRAYAAAVSVGDELYAATVLPEDRRDELRKARSFALLGAYAAARLGEREEAVRLAELGRGRLLADVLWATDAVLETEAPDARAELAKARARVLQLETRVREEGADPLVDIGGRLADHLGVPLDTIGLRRVRDPERQGDDEATEARAELSDLLARARDDLEVSMFKALAAAEAPLPRTLAAADVLAVADTAGYPIVYLLPSMHGCMTLAVVPEGVIRTLRIDGFTSSHSSSLLHGSERSPGYAKGAYSNDRSALVESLEACVPVLTGLVQIISNWLGEQGHSEAALVPCGSFAMLPMHAAIVESEATYRLIPSARVLRRGLQARGMVTDHQMSLIVVASSAGDDVPLLPFAAIEAASTADQFAAAGAQTEVLLDTDPEVILTKAATATHLHLACHAEFRPSDPFASSLFVGPNSRLTVAEIAGGGADLSSLELVTLSACESAATDPSLADEVIGFPSQLLAAGVPRVLGTAWPVLDEVAAIFTHRFYGEILRGRDAASATHLTQNWMRTATGEQVIDVVLLIQQALGRDNPAAQSALSDLVVRLSRQRNDRPFAAAEDWAAFAYWGI